MDYCVLYKNSNFILDNWSSYRSSLLSFLSVENHIKDKQIKNVIGEIQSTILSEKCQDAAILWCLRGYLTPSQKNVRKDINEKKTSKFSIKDSQESFVYVGPSAQVIEEHNILLLIEMSENVQSFIAVLGENILNIKEIFLYFDGVKFCFKSFVSAVDICSICSFGTLFNYFSLNSNQK